MCIRDSRVPIRVPGLSVLREVEELADTLTARYCPEGDERMNELMAVSYTHLDVYKRQVIQFPIAVNCSGVQRLGGRIDGNAGARQQEETFHGVLPWIAVYLSLIHI